jgi:hypothetical protein
MVNWYRLRRAGRAWGHAFARRATAAIAAAAVYAVWEVATRKPHRPLYRPPPPPKPKGWKPPYPAGGGDG